MAIVSCSGNFLSFFFFAYYVTIFVFLYPRRIFFESLHFSFHSLNEGEGKVNYSRSEEALFFWKYIELAMYEVIVLESSTIGQ